MQERPATFVMKQITFFFSLSLMKQRQLWNRHVKTMFKDIKC